YWLYSPNPGAIVEARVYNGGVELSTVAVDVVNTVGNWKLYVGTFTPQNGDYIKIKNYIGIVGGKTAYLDEVRLYPAGAQMVTATFKPLFGIGSLCDASNYITYTEYDALGRKTIVRDMRGNIISKTETVVDDSEPNTTGNYYSSPTY